MMKPTLIVMAAGMGSRFGGLKQITPVGPTGQKLMDYSVYDALRAGFGKIVFVIKHAFEEEFKREIGDAISAHVPVEYVFQELDKLPEGFTVPDGREKPWGTGHAVLCCRDVVHEPFVVLNSDDYYGRDCFQLLADFLADVKVEDICHIAMAGYLLKNTLTENGHVSRGVCRTDANGMLLGLDERTKIELHDGVPFYTEDDGATWNELDPEGWVSMNCWAFPAGSLDRFEQMFIQFLKEKGQEMKSEFYLPMAVDEMVAKGEADVKVLPTKDRWYGMTYAADHEMVKAALAELTENGVYPAQMWQ